jgi:hypothetical protein
MGPRLLVPAKKERQPRARNIQQEYEIENEKVFSASLGIWEPRVLCSQMGHWEGRTYSTCAARLVVYSTRTEL